MLRPAPDAYRLLVERLCLLMLPLSSEEVRQFVERAGHIGMLKPARLFLDVQGLLIE